MICRESVLLGARCARPQPPSSCHCNQIHSFFKLLKEEIIRLSDEGFTLLRMGELKQQLQMWLPDDRFTYEELEAVVGLLAGPGHVWQLEFGQFVLLHPPTDQQLRRGRRADD